MTAAAAKPLTSYRKYWAQRFGIAPFLPMSRAEMDALGWDECDVILVTGDAYIDHPSFGMALVGRLLEAQGFRVGLISQPDWHSPEDFKRLGKPKLFFGITAGNMDSMVNRYTADRKIRSDDAYTPDAAPDRRPDRAVIVYSQRAREAFPDVPVVIGGIEASLRRIAHYDYWSDKVRRSILPHSNREVERPQESPAGLDRGGPLGQLGEQEWPDLPDRSDPGMAAVSPFRASGPDGIRLRDERRSFVHGGFRAHPSTIRRNAAIRTLRGARSRVPGGIHPS